MASSPHAVLLLGVAYPAIVLSSEKTILAANLGLERLTGLSITEKGSNTIIGRKVKELPWVLTPINSPAYRSWDDLVDELLRRYHTRETVPQTTPAWLLNDSSDEGEEGDVRRGGREERDTEDFWTIEDTIRMAEELHIHVTRSSEVNPSRQKDHTVLKARLRIYLCTLNNEVAFIATFRRPRPRPSQRSDSISVLPPSIRTPWSGITTLDPKIIGDVDEIHSVVSKLIPHVLAIIGVDGQMEYLSPSWYYFTGLSEEQSTGSEWVDSVHRDDRPGLVAEWAAVVREGRQHWTTEARYRRYDGEYKYFLIHMHPIKDENGKILKWFASMLDVNDIVLSRIESDRRKQTILTVLSQSDVSLWAVNQSYEVIMLEGTLEWDPHGLSRHEKSSGKGLSIAETIQKVLDGESVLEIVEHQVDDRWYRTRFVADLKHGATDDDTIPVVEAALGLTIDVTDVKARAMLQLENERLIANEQAAQEASKLKSRFLANMSHEIRTPIAGIMGLNDLLLDTDLNAEQQDLGNGIQQSAAFLLTIINDILDFSKIESGHMDIEAVPFDLTQLTTNLHKLMDFQAKRKHLTLQYHNSLPKDQHLIGDPSRLQQVLTNLLSNSIKFTEKGSVTLLITVLSPKPGQEQVKTPHAVTPSENGTSPKSVVIQFVVEDTGIGIDTEAMHKLFHPFNQADSSTARIHGGTGLGLNISKQLVKLMGGNIELSSLPGVGTKASFWIPFEISTSSAQSTTNASKHTALSSLPLNHLSRANLRDARDGMEHFDGPSARALGQHVPVAEEHSSDAMMPDVQHDPMKPHVLVVEDNAINQKIALKTIRKLDFTVSAVWNGLEALQYLSHPAPSCPKPDIILMDCMMPVMDGYEATSTIRADKERFSDEIRKIPIIAMTASAIKGDKERCERAGMDDYLSKPVVKGSLAAMLEKWLDDKQKS